MLAATILVATFEGKLTVGGIEQTLYWAVTTVIGFNPAADFNMQPDDDAVVVAESLGTLAPLRLQHE